MEAAGMMENLHGVQVLGGSNPLAPTNRYKALTASALRAFFILGRFCPHVCPHTTAGSRGNGAEFSAGGGGGSRTFIERVRGKSGRS